MCVQLAHADSRAERERAEARCASHDPACDWLATLSGLERATVLRAIAARGYAIEPAPWGKVLERVRVYNEEVFAEPNRLLRFFNYFHITTREYAIAQEVVIAPGEVWDQARVDETARRLRDPLWSSVVVVLPIKSATPGLVDLLVVTRDVWSLRLNTQYTFQQGSLTNLSFSLSENNFLGTRSLVALGFLMDQGSIASGPIFLDRNVGGTGIELSARFDVIANRDDLIGGACGVFSSADDGACRAAGDPAPGRRFTYEGTQSRLSISRPLISLASTWAVGGSFAHRFAIDRRFRGDGLFPVDCSSGECVLPRNSANRVPDGPLDQAQFGDDASIFGIQYEMRQWSASVNATRQWGASVKHQLTVGHSVSDVDPRPLGSFPGNAEERAAFIRDVLPRTELSSTPFVTYGLFEPRFKTLRNVDSFELAEDARLGFGLELTAAFGLRALGGDDNFQTLAGTASYALPWCRDGLVRPSVSVGIRYQDIDGDGDHEFIDNTASATVRVITPTYGIARLVALANLSTRWNDASNRFFSIGSDSGLRGFLINEFSGQRLLRTQLEARSVPVPFWIVRLGAVVFYDAGGAADTFGEFQLHQDVGVGFRMLIPQTSRELFRFDLAVPLDGGQRGKARFIAGFESAF